MEWESKIIESNDDIDLNIFFYRLFSEKYSPVVLYVHPKYYKKLEGKYHANTRDSRNSN